MKDILRSVAVALFMMAITVGGTARAQSGYSVEKVVKTYTVKLGLSAQQVVKMRDILKKSYQQLQKDKAKFRGDANGFSSASMARMAQTDLDIMRMLTPDQVTKYQALKQAIREKREKNSTGK